jgi:hypothetical protein
MSSGPQRGAEEGQGCSGTQSNKLREGWVRPYIGTPRGHHYPSAVQLKTGARAHIEFHRTVNGFSFWVEVRLEFKGLTPLPKKLL